jgi:hypothetical protein
MTWSEPSEIDIPGSAWQQRSWGRCPNCPHSLITYHQSHQGFGASSNVVKGVASCPFEPWPTHGRFRTGSIAREFLAARAPTATAATNPDQS